MSKLGISTITLTDELILKYSGDRVIRNKGDINLRKDKVLEPVAGGLYDSNYFGSMYLDSCNCRAVKKVNTYCHVCGSTPLDEETRNSRFARIELPWYYVPYFKLKGLEKLINENFSVSNDFEDIEEVAGRGKLIRGLELGQVEIVVDPKKEKPIIRLHDQYTDLDKCSYEGLLKSLNDKGFESEAIEAKKFIDKNILVMPASMRGIKLSTIGGQRQITLPQPTAVYKSILMAMEQLADSHVNKLDQEVMLRAVLRSYIRKSLMELSEFTKSSKENLARRMFSARVPNTFRSVITAGPELRTDEVSIPVQNAYGILKDRYLDFLMSEKNVPFYKANEIYNKGSQDTLDMFEEWVKKVNPAIILVRQPALHKYSMMSFNIKIHKGHDMKLPLEICGPFGGDFDGDLMAGFLVPEKHQEDIMKKMSPIALKFYDKNLQPIVSPSHGVMHGYISCSLVDPSIGNQKKPLIVDTLEELEEMYNKEKVDLQQLVYLNGMPTTFGRAKMESYLGTSINSALGYAEETPLQNISNKNIDDLMRFITLHKNAAEVTKDIRIFVLEMSTLEGFSSLSLNQLYSGIPSEYMQRLEDVRNDPQLTGVQKFIRINDISKEMKTYVEDNMDQDLKQTMINSNRMKISALLEMTLPQATIDDDGRLLSNESSLYQSLNEEEYRAHGLQNRSILDLKQKLVPRSGYLNRQLYFLGQGLEYKHELDDKSNTGILIPHNRANGRFGIDNKKIRKSSSDKLVRVKSIAVSDKKYVCPEHLSSVSFPPEETTEAFGLRVMTTLTESFTQAGLSLKHSGSFVMIPPQNQLNNKLNVSGEIKLDTDNRILNVVDNEKIVSSYPLPDNFDVMKDKVNVEGDYIGTTLTTASAGLGLDVMIAIMSAKKAMPDEGLSKNVINLANCYSPVDGIIEYDFVKETFTIGGQDMGKIHKHAVYYYPQGGKVKKFDRIMSDPLDPQWYLKNNYPLEDVYFMFRKEFRSLSGNLTEELLEVLFHLLTKKDHKTVEHGYIGSTRGIKKGNESFFAQLSFERGKDAISKLSSGELKFENDIFTRNILDHMIISAKDNNKL